MFIEADKEAISVINQIIELGMRKGAFGAGDAIPISLLQTNMHEVKDGGCKDGDSK